MNFIKYYLKYGIPANLLVSLLGALLRVFPISDNYMINFFLNFFVFMTMLTVLGIIFVYVITRTKDFQRNFFKRKEKSKFLDEKLNFVYRLSKLESENLEALSQQLKSMIKDTEKDAFEIIRALEKLYDSAKSHVEFVSKLTSSSEENFVEIVKKQMAKQISLLEETMENLNQFYSEAVEIFNCLYNFLKDVNNLTPLVGAIEDIAKQINILSLNAAIEAARAGEKGKGFAVIAEEIRNLSIRTENTSKQVGEQINIISGKAKTELEEFKSRLTTEKMLKYLSMTKDTLKEVMTNFRETDYILIEIVSSIHEQSKVVFNLVTDLLGKVQWQDVIRQMFEFVIGYLEEVNKYTLEFVNLLSSADSEEKLKEISNFLQRFSELRSQMDAKVRGIKAKSKEEGPKIELF